MTELLPCPSYGTEPSLECNKIAGKTEYNYACCNITAKPSPTKEGAAYNWNHHPEVVEAKLKLLRSDLVRSKIRLSFIELGRAGITRATVQDCLVGALERLGLFTIGSCRSRYTLRNFSHEEMNVLVYVAMKDKDNGQKACFTVSGFMNPERPWFIFVVQPWGNVYLRRREEVMENLGEKARRDDTAYITISKGRRDCLFENRIDELINDKENWGSPPEVTDTELKRLRDKVAALEGEVQQLKAAIKFEKWDGKHWSV